MVITPFKVKVGRPSAFFPHGAVFSFLCPSLDRCRQGGAVFREDRPGPVDEVSGADMVALARISGCEMKPIHVARGALLTNNPDKRLMTC